MELERVNANTVVIHLAEAVEDDDAPALKQLLQSLYDEGVQFIQVDLSKTVLFRKTCLVLLIVFQGRLKERGGELSIINVTNEYVRHLFDMLDLHKLISIEEAAS